jgi:transposase
MLPHGLPPWEAVYLQARRWLEVGSFAPLVQDLRTILRVAAGRQEAPTAAIFAACTLWSTPKSRARAGYDGHTRRKGSKVHQAVDMLGHLLALHVSAANVDERTQVEQWATAVQVATGEHVEIAYVDQGYTGDQPAADAAVHGIRLVVIKLPETKRGFVLLSRRWVAERSFAWLARFRRLACDYEQLATTLAGCHSLAFAMLLLQRYCSFIVLPVST